MNRKKFKKIGFRTYESRRIFVPSLTSKRNDYELSNWIKTRQERNTSEN